MPGETGSPPRVQAWGPAPARWQDQLTGPESPGHAPRFSQALRVLWAPGRGPATDGYLEVEAVFQGAVGQEAIDEAVEAALSTVTSKVHDVGVTEPAWKSRT